MSPHWHRGNLGPGDQQSAGPVVRTLLGPGIPGYLTMRSNRDSIGRSIPHGLDTRARPFRGTEQSKEFPSCSDFDGDANHGQCQTRPLT